MIFVLYRLLVEQSAKNGEQACWIMVLKMLEIITMRWFTQWY
jgi:hypothetical protein